MEMTADIQIIGFDCAVDARKCGIALGSILNDRLHVHYVSSGLSETELIDLLCKEILAHENNLLAIDSPLGWPANLGKELSPHQAGVGIDADANNLFRRETDRFIKAKIGKLPLDVGADRIARTAWATLQRLDVIRGQTGIDLPLAWNPQSLNSPSCIEVYPAATLEAMGVSSKGYKGNTLAHHERRSELATEVCEPIVMPHPLWDIITQNDDALDSVICMLAGLDFINGKSMAPENHELAKKEGWIWARKK